MGPGSTRDGTPSGVPCSGSRFHRVFPGRHSRCMGRMQKRGFARGMTRCDHRPRAVGQTASPATDRRQLRAAPSGAMKFFDHDPVARSETERQFPAIRDGGIEPDQHLVVDVWRCMPSTDAPASLQSPVAHLAAVLMPPDDIAHAVASCPVEEMVMRQRRMIFPKNVERRDVIDQRPIGAFPSRAR